MSHTPVIDRWPSLSAFATDIGVSYGTAKAMRRRGSVPSEYWTTVVARAADRGLADVTLEALAEMAATRRAESVPAAPGAAA